MMSKSFDDAVPSIRRVRRSSIIGIPEMVDTAMLVEMVEKDRPNIKSDMMFIGKIYCLQSFVAVSFGSVKYFIGQIGQQSVSGV